MNTQAIYEKSLVNYKLISFTISFIVFIIYIGFSTKVRWLPLDFSTLVASTAVSILIGSEIALIIHFLSNIQPTFQKLCPLFQNSDCQKYLDDLKRKFKKLWPLCLTSISIITPFVILEISRYWKWRISNEMPPYFYLLDHTTCSLLLDIFNALIEYSIIFLLSIIIWIIIELTFSIIELQKKYEVKINLFEVDEIGGLEPLNTFVLFILSTYFVIITLIIISYTPPTETIYYHIYSKLLITPEIIILVIMLLIGIILFIVTQITIQRLIDRSMKPELKKINKNYIETYKKTVEICSDKSTNGKIKTLKELQITMDLLKKEEMRIREIQNKKFDPKTIITFITTVLIPIISMILKQF